MIQTMKQLITQVGQGFDRHMNAVLMRDTFHDSRRACLSDTARAHSGVVAARRHRFLARVLARGCLNGSASRSLSKTNAAPETRSPPRRLRTRRPMVISAHSCRAPRSR